MPCYTPFQRKDVIGHPTIPCGNCPDCILRRTNGWAFRLEKELAIASSASWPTLTYSDQNVPITDHGLLSLRKTDLQAFFKRLRKLNLPGIKYFAVGEYGKETLRPHYHVILMNAKIETIQPAWQQGEVKYGEVSPASIRYTLKYMQKHYKSRRPTDGRQPEFQLMSKGIGKSYLSEAIIKWHKADPTGRLYIADYDKKIAMPRYYKEKIFNEHEKSCQKIHFQNKADTDEKLLLQDPNYDQLFRNRETAVLAAFQTMHKNQNKKI